MITKASYYYTKTELKQLLDSIVILADTREKKNNHILNYLDKQGIDHKSKKLDFGDYSFMLPANKELGINRDIYFSNSISVERKSNLEEVSNNFTHKRAQFENELIRSRGSKLILLVEDQQGYQNILQHNYRTKYKPKSFVASLATFQARYNLDIRFLDSSLSGNFIYYSCRYWLREYLK